MNGLRLVVTSDWHLDAYTAGYARFKDVGHAVECVVRAVEEAVREVGAECVLFVFLGDLCDPDANRSPRCIAVAVRVAQRLRKMGVRSRWLNGNHDVIEDGTGTSTLSPLEALDSDEVMIRVLSRPDVEVIRGVTFCWLPYVPRALAYDPVEFVHRAHAAAPEVDVVAGHLNVPGIIPASETVDMGRGREEWFPLEAVRELWPQAVLMNGHYHRAHADLARTGPVLVPGSLARLTFGEQHNEPGYLDVRLSQTPGTYQATFHRVPTRLLVTMPPADGDRLPDDMTGALVRVIPPADATRDDVEEAIAIGRNRGAIAFKVHPGPTSPVELPLAPQVATARARGARAVVEELGGKAVGVNRETLAAWLDQVMSEVGL